MSRRLLPLLLMALTLFAAACSGDPPAGDPTPPEAAFSAVETTGPAPFTVQLLDESTAGSDPITAWSWDLGDGATSDDRNPAHTYDAPGAYSVSLTVTSASGSDTLERPEFILVYPPGATPTPGLTPTPTGSGTPTPVAPTPTPTATEPPTPTPTPEGPTADFEANNVIGVAPFDVAFEDLSDDGGSELLSWAWSFGDGGASTDKNPDHVFEAAGTYSVSLTVTNALGEDTRAKAGYIHVVAAEDALDIAPDAILIWEVLANAGSEGGGPFVELHNTTGAAIDVSGWYLGYASEAPLDRVLAGGSVVPAGGLLAIPLEIGELSPEGGYVSLASATEGAPTGYFQDEGYDPQPAGRSQGRHTTSVGEVDFVPLVDPTYRTPNAAPYVGPVHLSEIYYNPSADGAFEYVELVNTGAESVDLGAMGYALTDGVDFAFPGGVTLAPGARLIVAEDPAALRILFPSIPGGVQVLGPYDGRLSNSGERILLTRVEDVLGTDQDILQDRVSYLDEDPWPPAADGDGASLERIDDAGYGSDPATWASGPPSPGASGSDAPTARILITEIMYHDPSHLSGADWIELLNAGESAVDLGGYRFVDGIDYTFPPARLPAGAYVVVAADPDLFRAAYPGVTDVLGPFDGGQLSEKGERLRLSDPYGEIAQDLTYADQGAWAERVRGPDDHGHEGWVWESPSDGLGESLERRSLTLGEDRGLNWGPSAATGGSPGEANSLLTPDLAPIVSELSHSPLIPGPGDAVTISALIEDEGEIASAQVRYQVGEASAASAALYDDGAHGDGDAGDGIFAGEIPAQGEGAVVAFWVEATDGGGQTRAWPVYPRAAASPRATALYQVLGGVDMEAPEVPEGQDLTFIIMTEAERAELEDIGNGDDEEGIADEHDSDAQMNATVILWHEGAWTHRYHVGARNRGNSSRSRPPNNIRLNYPHDARYRGKSAINLNAKYPHAQIANARTFALAGIQAPTADPIQVRVNGVNLAANDPSMHGSYAAVEAENGEFIGDHDFPSDGNLYRGLDKADFLYLGADPAPYANWYRKQTNEELEDWSDVMYLTQVLAQTSEADYMEALIGVLDVPQWTRWMAVDNLLGNVEHGLVTGEGDDYSVFFPWEDAAVLVPHDGDSVLGDNQYYPDWTYEGYANVAGLKALMNHPEYHQLYHDNIRFLASTLYTPEVMNPLLDAWLGGWVAPGTLSDMKDFLVERRQKMLEQARAEPLILEGSTWRFFDAGRAPTGDWTSLGYDASTWDTGDGPFGWGESDTKTAIDAGGSASDRPMTVYFRHTFTVEDAAAYSGLITRIWRDDGAVVYLNGAEILRRDMPAGAVTYDTPADKELRGQSEPWFREDRLNDPSLLVTGQNVLAVEIHQRTANSEDMRFDFILRAIPNAPHPDESPEAWADVPWEIDSSPPLLPWPTRDGMDAIPRELPGGPR